jgi:hypothetical protein
MNTKKKPIHDPSCDEEILSIGGSLNPKGDLMDIHETLYLSDTNGSARGGLGKLPNWARAMIPRNPGTSGFSKFCDP